MNFSIELKLSNPTTNIPSWYTEADQWEQLNRDMGGNLSLSPLAIKAIYVIGVVFNICESVSYLLREEGFARQVSYVPAYGIYASSIELLGRSISGEHLPHKSCLSSGLMWLCRPAFPNYLNVGNQTGIIQTNQRQYSIEELKNLRNYAAHGQAVSNYYNVDYEIIGKLHFLLKTAVSCYWNELKNNENLCNNLAKANIIPLRGLPILKFIFLVNENHDYLQDIGDAFSKFDTLFLL
jgi:hypothetical protein